MLSPQNLRKLKNRTLRNGRFKIATIPNALSRNRGN